MNFKLGELTDKGKIVEFRTIDPLFSKPYILVKVQDFNHFEWINIKYLKHLED